MSLVNKSFALALVTVVAGASLTTQAEARRRHYRTYDDGGAYRGDYRNSRLLRSADHDRAVAADPTGSYRAYPDWARYALSPKTR